MDIQSERTRLLDAEGGGDDVTGLLSEQDAYLRSVNQQILMQLQSLCCMFKTKDGLLKDHSRDLNILAHFQQIPQATLHHM